MFDPLAALEEEAPILHPEVNSYLGLPNRSTSPPMPLPDTWSKGNIDAGFAQADLIVENTFTVPRQQLPRSPTPASYGSTIRTGTGLGFQQSAIPRQGAIICRAAAPKERIRLNPVAIGGDYGGKGSPMDIPLAYFLAVRTGRQQ